MQVFVVIPAYNAAATVQLALHSVLGQEHVRATIIVADHGSSDDTRSVVMPYVEAGRVRYIRVERATDERRSASRPLEEGVLLALENADDPTCAWFLRLDADDVLADTISIACLMEQAGGKRLVAGRLVFFDENNRLAETYTVAKRYRSKGALCAAAAYSMPHHTCLIRLDLISSVRGARGFAFDRNIGYGEDLDLTLALIAVCDEADIAFVDRDVCYKRLDGLTISRTAARGAIAVDHVRVFARHRLLFGKLALHTAIDLALQKAGLSDSTLRKWLGFPGKRWAESHPVPWCLVRDRLEGLAAFTPAAL